MFENFDISLFENPEFKEDSVREEIILPILTRLGYSASGPDRVIRSKSLVHPFIYAGTRKFPIRLIPDYTLLNDRNPLLVLDAKIPSENILSRKNVQQAYSYAIHPEIKCQSFALCNGKTLAIFSVDNKDPLLFVRFAEFQSNWDDIEKYLSPRYLKEPMLRNFAPDFGMSLARLGLQENAIVTFFPLRFNLVARIDEDLLTATSNAILADRPYCVSLDFSARLLPEILSPLPSELRDLFRKALLRSPFMAAAELAIELDLDTRLGPETSGASETFRPLLIERVIGARFDPTPLENEPTDIPPEVFRLRKAYVIDPR